MTRVAFALVVAFAFLTPPAAALPGPDPYMTAARDYWQDAPRVERRHHCARFDATPRRYGAAYRQGVRDAGYTPRQARKVWRAWRTVLDHRCDRFVIADRKKKR